MFNGGWAVLTKRFAVPPVAFCDSAILMSYDSCKIGHEYSC